MMLRYYISLFFFNATATTLIYTLSLHDALPISLCLAARRDGGSDAGLRAHPRRHDGDRRRLHDRPPARALRARARGAEDRKSTRLNSSHITISYAVFCLKKKKTDTIKIILYLNL